MSAVRKTAMLLASVFVLFAFLLQTSACFAEAAGSHPCHAQDGDSSTPKSTTFGDTHCCHSEFSALISQPVAVAPLSFREIDYHLRDFGVPEGPVEEIDYPPQLS
jgi:hypothetical protein